MVFAAVKSKFSSPTTQYDLQLSLVNVLNFYFYVIFVWCIEFFIGGHVVIILQIGEQIPNFFGLWAKGLAHPVWAVKSPGGAKLINSDFPSAVAAVSLPDSSFSSATTTEATFNDMRIAYPISFAVKTDLRAQIDQLPSKPNLIQSSSVT